MEKVRITLELTLEEARFVLNELEQFRYAKEEANKQQPEPQSEPRKDKHGNTMIPCNSDLIWLENALFDLNGKAVLPEPQPDPKPFKLEYGKRYKRRDGEITAPLVRNNSAYNETHPFKDPDLDISWQLNGQYGFGEEPHRLDLIEEDQ